MSNSQNTTIDEKAWPYDHVEQGEVRQEMSWQEAKALRKELETLRQLEEDWSCDRCGENKSTATKGNESLCNECIFGDSDE